jgi:hypothetical protein
MRPGLNGREPQFPAVGEQQRATVTSLCHRNCADWFTRACVLRRRTRCRQPGSEGKQAGRRVADRDHGRLWERGNGMVNTGHAIEWRAA